MAIRISLDWRDEVGGRIDKMRRIDWVGDGEEVPRFAIQFFDLSASDTPRGIKSSSGGWAIALTAQVGQPGVAVR